MSSFLPPPPPNEHLLQGGCVSYFGQWRDVATRFRLHDIVKSRLRAAVTVLRQANDRAGGRLDRASLYWLRHTFAMQALLARQDVQIVATSLGHAGEATTMLYTERETLDRIHSWESDQSGRVACVRNAGGNAPLTEQVA